MNLIQRLNAIFLGIILLTTFFVSGLFYYTSRDNREFKKEGLDAGEKNVLEYKKNFSGKISLGTINGVEILKNVSNEDVSIVDVENENNNNEEDDGEERVSLIFIGGELEEKNDNKAMESSLQEIANLNISPVIFTGDLVKFTNKDDVDIERIEKVKSILSLDFKGKFNIAFGKGDIACGEKCINGWSESLFGKKIATEEIGALLFAHSFEYKGAKFILLGPNFFGKEYQKSLDWLEGELKNNKQENLVVVSHNSIPGSKQTFSLIDCNEDCSEVMGYKTVELFEKYNVNLVVFGDEDKFSYYKKGNVSYVSSGNLKNSILDKKEVSFLRTDFNENEMMLFAYNNMQEKIEEFKIR